MKYWKSTPRPEGPEFTLHDTDDSWNREKVIEIKLLHNGEVRFMENCDGYYWFSVPKEEAIAILQEVIDLIKEEG